MVQKLKKVRKVSMIEVEANERTTNKDEIDDDDDLDFILSLERGHKYLGLLIQDDHSIYFWTAKEPKELKSIIEEEDTLSVKLEMLRGLRDRFYFALRDDGAASDSLNVISFKIDNEKLVWLAITRRICGTIVCSCNSILSLHFGCLNLREILVS